MLALAGGTVIPDAQTEEIAEGLVLIDGARIVYAGPHADAAIPSGAQTIDCTNLTVTPGFWNTHVHFFERKWAGAGAIPQEELEEQLGDFARYGFTTVFDLSSDLENTLALRARIESGEVAGPSILTTGAGLVPPGALPPDVVNRMMGMMPVSMPMVSAAGSVDRAVDAAVAGGADAVKIFASGNARESAMSARVMQRAIERAHASGKPVFVHVNTERDVQLALSSGADVIAHTTPRTPWSDETLAQVEAGNAAITPTLGLWETFLRHDRLSAKNAIVAAAVEQLRSWIARGAGVLFGTDYGAVEADPSREFALMAAAGMDFRAILHALTTAPAGRFGERSGRLVQGYRADAVAFAGDPAAVRCTVQRGRVVFRA